MKLITIQKLQDLYKMEGATKEELSQEAERRTQIIINKTLGK